MKLRAAVLCLLLSILPGYIPLHGQGSQGEDARQMDLAQARAKLAAAPLSFARNMGQWPDEVRFASQMRGLDLWVTDSSILYDLNIVQELGEFPGSPTIDPARQHLQRKVRRSGHLIHMRFAGANPEAFAEGAELMEGRRNYFLGNDPKRWASDVPLFGSARIREIYRGIDLILHFDDALPRYDFLVRPGTNPAAIRFRLDGADRVSITPSGELAIATSLGVVRQRKLFAYQETGGTKRQIPCSFRKHSDGTIGFVLGDYDKRQPLVIDPILYSTFLGGSGHDNAIAMVTDGGERAYMTGYAGAPSPVAKKFPTTTGAYERTEQGNSDIFVTRMDVHGGFAFSTLIGGDGFEDGRAIALDGGSIVVSGFTGSSDFPTTANALSPTYNGGSHDAFVLKLNGAGSALTYSTFLGGSGGDAAYSLSADGSGNLRVCGHTFSQDFPTTPGAYDRSFNGGSDIFVSTLDPSGEELLASTYIGGSAIDFAYAVKTTFTGRAYVAGTSFSADFPTVAPAMNRHNRGGSDVVVFALNTTSSALDYSTYVGGVRDDYAQDLLIDPFGGVVFSGFTASSDYPLQGNAIFPAFSGGDYDGFITRLAADGSSLIYSTYVGGSGDDYVTALAQFERRYWIAGYSASGDLPFTLPAVDTAHSGGHDGFVMHLDLFSDSLYYGSFVGNRERDIISDMALDVRRYSNPFDNHVTLYLCGTTASHGFPTTRNAYAKNLAPVFEGGYEPVIPSYDAFFMRFDPRGVLLRTQTPSSQILLCPNGTFEIRWLSYDLATIRIFLLDEHGTRFASALYNNGPGGPLKWEWLIPGNQPAGTRFRLAILDARRDDVGDTGEVDFTIIDEPKLLKGISSVDACPGEKLTFAVEAEGYQIAYRWRLNNFTIFGANGPVYVIDSLSAADTGVYELAVYDACGSIQIAQTARVRMKPIATIIEQPAEARICTGLPVSFSVTAEGTGLRYQWYKDRAPIPGATSPVLAFDSVAPPDQATYTCHIRNDECPDVPAITKPARLVVVYERIIEQPKSQIVRAGQPVSFHIVATGTSLTYQWRKNGVEIPGATSSTYTIEKARPGDAGTYDVLISGECALEASPAVLTVENTGAVTGEPYMPAAPWRVQVHPNPVSLRGVIHLFPPLTEAEMKDAELALFDMLGRKVLDLGEALRAGGLQGIAFDAAGLPAGVYHCRLSANGRVAGCSVVIER